MNPAESEDPIRMQTMNAAGFLARHDLKDDRFDRIAGLLGPKPGGPWLVGGSVRRLVTGAAQDSDFDVAFPSEHALYSVKAALVSQGFEVRRETAAHVELFTKIDEKPTTVQLLKIAYAPEPWGVLDTFDFTICQCAYDGENLTFGPYTLWDLGRRRLAIHKVTYAASTVRRMLKYGKQGYTFCQGTIVNILESVVEKPETIQATVEYVD